MRWMASATSGVMLAACTLTTNLDGYAGPAPTEPEASSVMDANGGPPDVADAGADEPEASIADAYAARVLADLPLGYWRFEDADDVKVRDAVGMHDGVAHGTTHVAGALGRGVSFVHQAWIDLGNSFVLDGRTPFTLEAWVMPTVGGASAACIVAKDTTGDGGSVQDGWAFYVGTDNTLFGTRFLDGSSESVGGPVVAQIRFTHVAVTYDGARLALYVDGTRVTSQKSEKELRETTIHTTIGASRGGEGCFFRGALDELAIYGRALDDTTLRAHAELGAQPP